ncbi:MAG: hypothetical protein D6741_21120 [Planctomycetota bacterium]|nr:MAG: hypothetical protein D6741_21120 [Planctomycetota bacterium]
MNVFQRVFSNWPGGLPHRGVVVTTLNEQIPFSDFRAGDDAVYLVRTTPDAIGGRSVILPWESIAALKFVDEVRSKVCAELGFEKEK